MYGESFGYRKNLQQTKIGISKTTARQRHNKRQDKDTARHTKDKTTTDKKSKTRKHMTRSHKIIGGEKP